MKVILQVEGIEMTFSEEELIAILKEHFKQAKPEQQEKPMQEPINPIRGPEEGVPFEVNPSRIDRNLFQTKREDSNQEEMRQIILEALDEVKKNPNRYGKAFWTLQPEKTWDWDTIGELVKLAKAKGDHIANWVEQALEWAQRIQNGETWEAICNEPDTANWYRLIQWKNGFYRLVGGSYGNGYNDPAFYVGHDDCRTEEITDSEVPLVVLYS